MASIGRFRTNCLGSEWFNGAICPSKLYTYIGDGGSGAERWQGVNFAGRGKVDAFASCGGSDSYVTFSGGPNTFVDVWKAYRDGVWTSSVSIQYYLLADAVIASALFEVCAANLFSPVATRTVALAAGVAYVCPPTLKFTVTVTDAGGISVSP